MYQLITAILFAFESGVNVQRSLLTLRHVMDAARETNTPLPIDLLLAAVLYECGTLRESEVRAQFGTDVSLLVAGFTRDPRVLPTRTLGVAIIALADTLHRATTMEERRALADVAEGMFARYSTEPYRGVQLADKMMTVGARLLRIVRGDRHETR